VREGRRRRSAGISCSATGVGTACGCGDEFMEKYNPIGGYKGCVQAIESIMLV